MVLLKFFVEVIKDFVMFKIGWVVLLFLLVGFFVLELFGILVSVIVVVGVLILFVVVKCGYVINMGKVLCGVFW